MMRNIMWIYSSMNKAIYQQGTAMVELAILLPLLFTLFFGVTELGRALYQQNMLAKTVGSTTRMLSRAYQAIDINNNCAPIEPAWTTATGYAENMLKYGDIDGGSDLLLNGLELVSITVTSKDLDAFSKSLCTITVSAKSEFLPIIADTLFGFPAIDLTSETEERYIGE